MKINKKGKKKKEWRDDTEFPLSLFNNSKIISKMKKVEFS